MRRVSELQKLTGGRYQVRLDDGCSFPLYGRELLAFHIEEDAEVPEAVFTEIMEQLLPKRAKLCALNYLKRMDRTESQLLRKLQTLGYPEEISGAALDYVKQYRYIDDMRYACSYIEYRKESRSLRQLEQDLMQKGISRDVIQEAMMQAELPEEDVQISRWLQKKHYRKDTADQKETERIYRFLLRKGYSSTAVLRMMRADLCE